MKTRNFWLIAAVLVITVLSLWLAPAPGVGPDGEAEEAFSGSDGKAQAAIGELAPDYEPWFSPLLEPAGGEIESLLFALQAALGAGVIGYWLGAAVTRERLGKNQHKDPHKNAPPEKSERAD